MKCPNCKSEMEKGYLEEGTLWRKVLVDQNKFFSKLQGPFVYAFMCPECGKVELTTETK